MSIDYKKVKKVENYFLGCMDDGKSVRICEYRSDCVNAGSGCKNCFCNKIIYDDVDIQYMYTNYISRIKSYTLPSNTKILETLSTDRDEILKSEGWICIKDVVPDKDQLVLISSRAVYRDIKQKTVIDQCGHVAMAHYCEKADKFVPKSLMLHDFCYDDNLGIYKNKQGQIIFFWMPIPNEPTPEEIKNMDQFMILFDDGIDLIDKHSATNPFGMDCVSFIDTRKIITTNYISDEDKEKEKKDNK